LKLFYPLKAISKQGEQAENTFKLAFKMSSKEVAELFIKLIANILLKGEEISNLVIEDFTFFKNLFSYDSFPFLLDSL